MGIISYIFIVYALVVLFSVTSMAYFFCTENWNKVVVAGVATLVLLFGFCLADIIV